MATLMIGTYAEPGGAGLVPLVHDVAEDRWSLGTPVTAIRNASFGVTSSVHSLHYFVDEDAGRIGVYDRRCDWTRVAQVDSAGEAPCHIALDAQQRRLAVANYGDGSVALFTLDAHGLPQTPPAVHRNEGSGPNRDRQAGPHAHWVGFSEDGNTLLTVDLGSDRIFAIPIDPKGQLGPARAAYAAPAGSGPRHLAFHPRLPLAYLVSELADTVTVLDHRAGDFQPVATQPLTREKGSFAGAIAVDADGKRLYTTTRGADRIVGFTVDADGSLEPVSDVASAGASPRFLLLMEEHLLVANQQGGTVAVFRLDSRGRPLPPPQVLKVPGAAFAILA